ncbi:dihydroorotate dehydrogenase electron transfer subunit [Ruminococcus flavefaciens]|uniref:Dihydroorotate dehydrogenase B (NAD(+)), electron transfer subunit n=1 Tax=Ruminococcus flavefaciens TaxID=1265 RepID=A0A1H6KB10_RUMFL|nr:dihydroorotate dehydrogenase electron transfer subunit [Ruminococcus flavefaciens]SEH68650.1 dihydroorotate dehydrogenase electron transfer subunit [Ruminococcus flavefaciens]
MKYTQGQYIIADKTAIAREIYSFTISCPEVAAAACPGQFVHIRAKGYTLRRPISICGIDKEKGTLRIVFEIRGEGTAEIAKLNKGDLIDMLAPLGHGFTVEPSYNKIVLIGGGIGTPPMLPLAKAYGDKAVAISGFRNASAVILQDDFRKTGAETILCTDDGSAGIHGFVTQPLKELAEKGGIDAVYACGPIPMLKGVAAICKENGIFCQISLEERMACGIGACLGCACRTVRNDEEYFAHVCKDGPVFNAEEVLW